MANSFLTRTKYVDGILKLARARMVFGKLFNQNYSGDVKHNQSVKIEKIPRVYTSDHTKGSAINYQDLKTGNETLSINQAKNLGIFIDDLEAIQSNPNLQAELMVEISNAMKKAVEEYLALTAKSVSGANIRNAGSAVSLATDNKAYTEIAELVQLLKDGGIEGDINVIVPPVVTKRLGIDTKFLTANREVSRIGIEPVIKILGAMVYESPFDTKVWTVDDAKVGTVDNTDGYDQWATTLVMDTGNVVETGYAKIVDTDEIVYVTATADTSLTIERAKNGTVNKVIPDGATIKNVTKEYLMYAGNPSQFATYAMALEKLKTGQSELKVGDYVQGIIAFGAKVLNADAGAISYVKD